MANNYRLAVLKFYVQEHYIPPYVPSTQELKSAGFSKDSECAIIQQFAGINAIKQQITHAHPKSVKLHEYLDNLEQAYRAIKALSTHANTLEVL